MSTILSLAPQNVWKHFYSLTQIPRPSGHMEKVTEFLINFGKGLGLESFVDEAGNVIIRKPATPGMENRKGVILQAHMDMVPQKNNDTVHDFEKDPIETFIDGDWVKAKGTTLGADNGLGVAAIMAVLEAIQHLHCFFIFAKLCVANTSISFCQISCFCSAVLISYFQETCVTDAVTV